SGGQGQADSTPEVGKQDNGGSSGRGDSDINRHRQRQWRQQRQQRRQQQQNPSLSYLRLLPPTGGPFNRPTVAHSLIGTTFARTPAPSATALRTRRLRSGVKNAHGILSSSLSTSSSYEHQARRSRRSGQSSCWANATSVAVAADVEDGLRSQRPTQLAQCPPWAHDVMAAAVGEAVLAAAAAAVMVAAVAAAQQ
ncbi:hypothetical protein QJQ45_015793, partial [Haematococcus lacustris]